MPGASVIAQRTILLHWRCLTLLIIHIASGSFFIDTFEALHSTIPSKIELFVILSCNLLSSLETYQSTMIITYYVYIVALTVLRV